MEIRRVDREKLLEPLYRELTELYFRNWTADGENLEDSVAFAAVEGTELVGLLIVDTEEDWALVQSLKIKEGSEGKGVMSALLNELELFLKPLNVKRIDGEFEETPELVEALKLNEWSEPVLTIENYFFYTPVFRPNWFVARPPAPEGFKLVKWADSDPEKIAELQELGKYTVLPISSEDPHPIELINSLFLVKDRQIAGWIETHRLSDELIRYTSLYVYPEYRRSGAFLPLLAESIWLQVEASVLNSLFEVESEASPPTWQSFVKRKLAPSATRIYKTVYSFKIINMLVLS